MLCCCCCCTETDLPHAPFEWKRKKNEHKQKPNKMSTPRPIHELITWFFGFVGLRSHVTTSSLHAWTHTHTHTRQPNEERKEKLTVRRATINSYSEIIIPKQKRKKLIGTDRHTLLRTSRRRWRIKIQSNGINEIESVPIVDDLVIDAEDVELIMNEHRTDRRTWQNYYQNNMINSRNFSGAKIPCLGAGRWYFE